MILVFCRLFFSPYDVISQITSLLESPQIHLWCSSPNLLSDQLQNGHLDAIMIQNLNLDSCLDTQNIFYMLLAKYAMR